jgi:hypothetical protein
MGIRTPDLLHAMNHCSIRDQAVYGLSRQYASSRKLELAQTSTRWRHLPLKVPPGMISR